MDDYLKSLMEEYRKNKEARVSDYDADPYTNSVTPEVQQEAVSNETPQFTDDADPYGGLVTPEMRQEEEAIKNEALMAQDKVNAVPNEGPQEDIIDEYQKRHNEIDEEMKDVKLQQKEHKLLGAKSALAKLKVKNDADDTNEYSVAKELADTSINSYDEDPTKSLDINPNDKVYGDIPPKVLEQKAAQALKTREDGIKTPADVTTSAVKQLQETKLTPQEQLMKEYQEAKLKADEENKAAGYVDTGANILRALAQYGSTVAASKATRAGAKGVTGDLGFKTINNASKVEAKNLAKLNKLQDMIDKLNSSKKKGMKLDTKIVETSDGVKLVDMQSGKIINKIGDAKKMIKEAKHLDTLSTDNKSAASKAAQERLYKAGFEGDLSDYSERQIEENEKALTRKITTKLQKKKEKRMQEKQAWQIGEKDEVSDKQLESLSSLMEMKRTLQRIKDLKKKVNTGAIQQLKFEAQKYLPGNRNSDRIALNALVGTNLSKYIKGISGTAVSEPEARRLSQNIPSMELDDKEFNRMIKEYEKTLDETIGIRMKNMKEFQGRTIPKNMSEYLEMREVLNKGKKSKKSKTPKRPVVKQTVSKQAVAKPAASKQPVSTMVKIKRLSDGKVKLVDAKKAENYLKNPNFERVE